MKRVLIVDDKEQNLLFLRSLLEGSGFEVETAGHGAEALIRARHTSPDLIISDLLMPVMDGYTLLRHWKADERLKAIPFVVYTATYTEPKDERLALDMGADAFIIKPVEPEPFMVRIRDVLQAAKRHQMFPPRVPKTEEKRLLKEYSEVLIRKLEEKTLNLQEANAALQRDIEARKETEEALRESERRFRMLVENAPDAIFVQTQNRFSYLNAEAVRLFGAISAEQLLGQPVLDRFHPEFRTQIQERIRLLNEGKVTPRMEQKYLRLDATEFDVEVSAVPIRYNEQNGALVFARDITDRKRAQARIQEQQETIRELSTPVLEASQGMLVVPLVGSIDSARAGQVTEQVLKSIRAHRAKVVVMDITGVATMDAVVANHLIQTAQAARLLGARVIVTGMSREIALTLVTLGVNLTDVRTVGDLRSGIEEGHRLLGYELTPLAAPQHG